MAKRSVQELKGELQKLKSVIPWSEVKPNEVYHVPPIISLERRDLYIISKTKDTATYRRVGDTEQKERTMHETSVFARFLVKKKKY
jgi:hypothetical protein